MKLPRVMISTTVLAGLLAAALVAVPEVTTASGPETLELPEATAPGIPALAELVTTVTDLLSNLPEVPLLTDLLKTVLDLLSGLLGGVGGSEGSPELPSLPGGIPTLPVGGLPTGG